jgi:hypothetical protein
MNTAELNLYINNPKYLELFTTGIRLTLATYQDLVVEGHEESQQLIDSVTIRLEANDKQGAYIDSRIFTVRVPHVQSAAGTAGAPQFVPYPELTLEQILDWPCVQAEIVKEITEFQSRIYDQVTRPASSTKVLFPNFSL